MRILLALIVGVLAFLIAHIVFNEVISALIGLLAGASVMFGDRFLSGDRL